MAAFTTIAAYTVAVGGNVAKGILAGDSATVASREAGRLRLQQEELEQESVARLEENFYDAVRATTDIYDKQLQAGNVMGSQILEAVQEGDQRGVAAGAGKVKQASDATFEKSADKMAQQKLIIDMARAKAGEMSASEIAKLQDDRAAAAGLKAAGLTAQANKLKGEATGSFIDAGASALQAGISLAGSIQGKAGQDAIDSGLDKATVAKMTPKEIRQYNRGDSEGILASVNAGSRSLPGVSSETQELAGIPTENILTNENNEDLSESPMSFNINGANFSFNEITDLANKQQAEREEAAKTDIEKLLETFSSGITRF